MSEEQVAGQTEISSISSSSSPPFTMILPVLCVVTGEMSTLLAMALSLCLKYSRGLSGLWAMMAAASYKHI